VSGWRTNVPAKKVTPTSGKESSPNRFDELKVLIGIVAAVLKFEPDMSVVGLAQNGREAVEQFRELKPDVVLMDLAMPVKDGFTAAAELKAHPATAEIPILALTALAMPGDERRALEAGFDGYLAKPIDTRQLEEAVSRCLDARAEA